MTASIIIEPLQLQHIDSYLAQFSFIIRRTLSVFSLDSERAYLEMRCAATNFFYVIKDTHTASIIGAIEIRDPGHLSQLYCWLNEQYWGRGYFSYAFKQVLYLYHDATGEKIITACVDENNLQSLRALMKNGFKKKGSRLGPQGKQIILELHINDILQSAHLLHLKQSI